MAVDTSTDVKVDGKIDPVLIPRKVLDALGIEYVQFPDTKSKDILLAWENIIGLTLGAYRTMISNGVGRDVARLIVSEAVVWKPDVGNDG